MIDSLLQDITIYSRDGKQRYNVRASVRNTEYLNRNTTGLENADNILIRIFDVDGYAKTWFVDKEYIIVLMKVTDTIQSATLTELRKKYGKENVIEVSSVDKHIYDLSIIKPLNHIKIGGR